LASRVGGARDWLRSLWWLVVPVLAVGLFARVYYTPDEPREAALGLAMAAQEQHAVPVFGGQYFMEKPPLLYWLSGISAGLLGSAPAALRLPGLLYALLAVGSLAHLARRAAGPRAGFVAGVTAATLLICYQVEIWLATDAPLLAGVALSLCGLFNGYTATTARRRRWGYIAFHGGLLLAFFAKNIAGWMVPVLAFLTLVIAERRWRELLRAELWLPVPMLAAAILAWVAAVATLPDGHETLRVFFWNNLVGRAVDVGNAGAYVYTTGHLNSPGKYLLELPAYLLPWTALVPGAALAALRGLSDRSGLATARRLALGAIVPATLLLSLAATARGVYYAPAALGFALLVGLWAGEMPAVPTAAQRRWLGAAAVTVAAFGLLVGGLAVVAAAAPHGRNGAALALGLVALAGILLTGYTALRALRAPSTDSAWWHLAVGVAVAYTACAGPLYLRLNPWLDLARTAAQIRAVAAGPVELFEPDETTEAMAELYLPGHADPHPGSLSWVLVPSGARRTWRAREWRLFLADRAPPLVRVASEAPARPELTAICEFERPGGRSYVLYAPPHQAGDEAFNRCRMAAGQAR
jgi:4-amino-4-deoxy-L-arabinose transferase-like glycosyltransferase